ncbi:MAG: M48 family metalloprotease [bacterium]|nr:M48 family metalloprotease [bacterium]
MEEKVRNLLNREGCKRLAALALFGFFTFLFLGCAASQRINSSAQPRPEAGSPVFSDIELGKKIFEELKPHLKFTDNPLIQLYVDQVGKRIIEQVYPNRFEFRYFVIKSDQLNAFALPNGYIFLTERLLNSVKTEDELAFVLCHETAHVVKTHFRRLMEKKSKVDMATMAAMIAGVLLSKDSEMATAVQAFSVGANQSFFLKYSREFEDEADETGFNYLIAAGYRGQGAIDFMEKLHQLERITITAPIYLSTHPATSSRVYHLEQMSRKNPSKPIDPVGNIRRLEIWSRLETENPHDYWHDLQTACQRDPNNPDLLYGLALALGKIGRQKEALDFFQKCLSLNPNDQDALRDMGISLFRQGEYAKAQKSLEQAVQVNHEDFLAFHYLGRTLKEMHQPDEAIAKLTQSKELEPEFADNYYYLGLLFQQKGKIREAHENFSTHFALRGNQKAAQFHRQEAERLKTNGK